MRGLICPHSDPFRLFWWAYSHVANPHSPAFSLSSQVHFCAQPTASHNAGIDILIHNDKFLTPKMICIFWFGKFSSDRKYHYEVHGSREQTGTYSYMDRIHFQQNFYTFLFYIYRCWFEQLLECGSPKRLHHQWNQI